MKNFITFEGGEGSGKSTLIESLKTYCKEHDVKSIFTREPGGLEECEQIRNILISSPNLSNKAQLLLFSASRRHLCEKLILPALQNGNIVFCDRFYDSTRVYQGYANTLSDDDIMLITDFAVEDVRPQLTFYLDIDPIIAFKRKGGADENDVFEQKDITYHQKIREGYNNLALIEPERIIKIDASQGKQKVFEDVLNVLKKENIINA